MRVVSGAGVTLEPQIASHAAALFAAIGDPALYAYIDAKEPESEAALRERLEKLESRVSPDGAEQWLNWVVRTAGGSVAGYVQATIYPDRTAEIAYVLGREFWRRGIGAAACAAMIDELAAHYGVNQLTATLDPANTASLALLRKLGFALIEEMPEDEEVRYGRMLSGAR